MKLYIASYFNTCERLRPYVRQLQDAGHIITSTWLSEPIPLGMSMEDYLTSLTPKQKLSFAQRDVGEVLQSDALILDTLDEDPRGGREVEWGAFVFDMIDEGYIVGPKRNVFHELAVEVFPTWEACVEYCKDAW